MEEAFFFVLSKHEDPEYNPERRWSPHLYLLSFFLFNTFSLTDNWYRDYSGNRFIHLFLCLFSFIFLIVFCIIEVRRAGFVPRWKEVLLLFSYSSLQSPTVFLTFRIRI